MTCSSHDDNTGKMTMNRRRRQKRKQEGAGRNLGVSLMARRRGLTRGIGRLWKGCGKRATWGYKPLSRTITIHAINLSLGPVTRIMRAVRVSASITFEIPYGLGLTTLSPPLVHVLLIALTHVIFLFFCLFESPLTIITRFHDFFSPWYKKKDLCIFDEFFFFASTIVDGFRSLFEVTF